MAIVQVPTSTPGGMTLLSTTTLTGASVTLSSIPQTYYSLYLVIRDWLPANDNTEFGFRFNADSTANRHTSVGYGVTQVNTAISFNQTYINTNCGQDNSITNSLINFTIPDYTNTVTWKKCTFEVLNVDPTTTTQLRQCPGIGFYNQTSAVTSLELFPASGNFTSGTALLYGVK